MSDIQFFQSDKGVTAYKQIASNASVSLFFLSGHSGTFDNPIRHVLTDFAQPNSIRLTHFTYFGREQSHSDAVPEDGTGYIQHRLEQALALFDAVTTEPQILIGSSMGGYLALALAQARPERVTGIVGLAAGFGVELVDATQAQYQELRVGTEIETGFMFAANFDNSLPIVGQLQINCPVRLRHAMSDDVVSYKNTDCIANVVTSNDVVMSITKEGNHSLDRLEDNQWLEQSLLGLI